MGLLMLGSVVEVGAQDAGPQTGDVLRETLPNGLRVVIVRNRLAPVVTTVINYEVGSNEAPDGFPGMAHAQEHMMFRGSPDLSAGQLAEIAAGMGGEFDADTQQTVTQYFFTVPAEDWTWRCTLKRSACAACSTPTRCGTGTRRDRAGSGAGPFESELRVSTRSCSRAISGHAVRPRRARHPPVVR